MAEHTSHKERGNPLKVVQRIAQAKGEVNGNAPAIPVHILIYDNPDEREVKTNEDGEPRITNHSELEYTKVVRGMPPKVAENFKLDVVTSDRVFWREKFADIALGEQFELK